MRNKRTSTRCGFCGGFIVFLQDEREKPVAVNVETVKKGDVQYRKIAGHTSHTETCEDYKAHYSTKYAKAA